MASIRKRGQNWQAQIRRQGHPPIVKTFIKKADAEAWARQTEVAHAREDFAVAPSARPSPQLSVMLDRYSREITPKKRGVDAEQYRIKTLLKHEIAQTPISTRLQIGRETSTTSVANIRSCRSTDVPKKRHLKSIPRALNVGKWLLMQC